MNRRSREIMLLPLLVVVLLGNNVQTAEEGSYKTNPRTSEPSLKSNILLSTTKDPSKLIPDLPPEVPTLSSDSIKDESETELAYEQVMNNFKKNKLKARAEVMESLNRLNDNNANNNHHHQYNDEAVTDKDIKKVLKKVIEAGEKKPETESHIELAQLPSVRTPLLVKRQNKSMVVLPVKKSGSVHENLEELIGAEVGTTNDDGDIDNFDKDEDDEEGDDEDDDDDDDDEDDDTEDEEDEDDEDDDEEDDEPTGAVMDDGAITIDEEVITQCPDYCQCSGEYAQTTTAICSKLIDKQNFGFGIDRLTVKNAGSLILGPRVFKNRNLQQLESIVIVNTPILSLDRAAFDGIPYLYAVNLSRNGMVHIDPDTFENNTQLNMLTISEHPYWQEQSDDKPYFFNAPTVSEFVFSWNSLNRLQVTAFEKMPSLTYLSLKRNRLGKIESNTFKPLRSLHELDLSGNMLSHLPADLFTPTNLNILKLSDNFMTTLSTINCSTLKSLVIDTNHIQVIEQNDFAGVPLLSSLIISWNSLERIHDHAFAHLPNLEHLDISNNNVASLSDIHFRNNQKLQILILSNNPNIRVLPKFHLKGSSIESFAIYRFECNNCGLINLDRGAFKAMPALTTLSLADNQLVGLPDGALGSLSSLRELDLSDNAISIISPNMLDGAITLTKLNLAGNRLVTLQVTPFLKTRALQRLDVSRCHLRKIWSEARTRLRSLRFMSLYGNKLERITLEDLKTTSKLSGLDISQNPLICDDEFKQALQWLTRHGVLQTETVKMVSNIENGQESYIGEKRNGEWSDLARTVCNSADAPPPRRMPEQPTFTADENDAEISKADIEKNSELFVGHGHRIDNPEEDTWPIDDNKAEYEDYDLSNSKPSIYRSWYGGPMWPLLTTILVVASALLIILQTARCISQRRGRVPVLRGLNLYPSLDVNKNSGAVYKPLQEEIPTPKLTKKGGFFLISPWTHSEVVPESV